MTMDSQHPMPADDSQEVTLHTASEDATRSLGREIGTGLRPGDVVTLTGTLGSGKTVLAQGIAQGLEVPDDYDVTSPTYTLVNVYPGRIDFYHLDLYRISGPVDPADLELDEILFGNGASVVEWPDRLPSGYLFDHLAIALTVNGPTTRQIACRCVGADLWKRIKPIMEMWRKKET